MAIVLTIEFETALHQGSGYGIAGIVDRALMRDGEGIPVIPGSALKGKFREAAVRILNTKKVDCCARPKREICKGDPFCQLCRIFGSPMRRGDALFGDARPTTPELAVIQANQDKESWLPGGTQVRATTAMDRRYRTVRPQHLFSTEVLSPLIRFEAAISGALAQEDTTFLEQCSRLITFFGGGSSRGLGHGRIQWRVR